MLGAFFHKGYYFPLGLILFVSACSPITHHYRQVEYNISRQDFLKADDIIEKQRDRYGSRNDLLYTLDRAMTLHLAGRYQESNQFLDRAEHLAETLYTKSLTSQAGAMLTNDNTLPYEGEDFERVMINLIAALNYVYLHQLDEALVEVRKVDHKLNLLNDRYEKKNTYKEDAFARYLSGMLYEAKGELNDAWIDYRKAYEAYEHYKTHYHTPFPERLKADLLRLTESLGLMEEHQQYLEKFKEIPWIRQKEYDRYGEIVFISYNGLSPIKEDFFISAPIPDGQGGIYLLSLAMPRFVLRPTNVAQTWVTARNAEGSTTEEAVLVEDIATIAIKNLEDRIGRITAKAIARATTKYLMARAIREKARESDQALPRILAEVGTNLYSVLSEQADKRSWRLLPGEIQMARILVPPGIYTVEIQYKTQSGHPLTEKGFMEIAVRRGEKRFLSDRTVGSAVSLPKASQHK